MIMKGDSQQLKFNHYCGLFIISLNFACRDFNVKLKLCAVIKFRAQFKSCPAGKISSYVVTTYCLSRHNTVVGGQ